MEEYIGYSIRLYRESSWMSLTRTPYAVVAEILAHYNCPYHIYKAQSYCPDEYQHGISSMYHLGLTFRDLPAELFRFDNVLSRLS